VLIETCRPDKTDRMISEMTEFLEVSAVRPEIGSFGGKWVRSQVAREGIFKLLDSVVDSHGHMLSCEQL